MGVAQGCALGESCARLLDYYAQAYLAAGVAGASGESVVAGDASEGVVAGDANASGRPQVAPTVGDAGSASVVSAEDIAANWQSGAKGDPLGALYDTYDLSISADDAQHELDLSGYKPAGKDTKLVWQ
jgi:hypothetical protein